MLYCAIVEQMCQQLLLTELWTWATVVSATQGKIVNITTANKSLQFAAQFRHLVTTLSNGKLRTRNN